VLALFGVHHILYVSRERVNNSEEVTEAAMKAKRVLLGYIFKFLCSEHG